MQTHPTPFLVVNPKSYLYGEEALALAKASDAVAKRTGLTIYFTCPFSDIRLIRENTDSIIVTAQAMESLPPGRGMGHLLPEALYAAGARATFLNHAEQPMTIAELSKTIVRARELGITTIACADSLVEGRAIAAFSPDILLCEPTDLIGTGKTATAEQAQEIHAHIRHTVADKYGSEVANATSILYGGSCNAGNAKTLFANPDVDGGLIGGASLAVDKFLPIIEAF